MRVTEKKNFVLFGICIILFLFAILLPASVCYGEDGIEAKDRLVVSYPRDVVDQNDGYSICLDENFIKYLALSNSGISDFTVSFDTLNVSGYQRILIEVFVFDYFDPEDKLCFEYGNDENMTSWEVSLCDISENKVFLPIGDETSELEYLTMNVSGGESCSYFALGRIYLEKDIIIEPLDTEYTGTYNGMLYENDIYPSLDAGEHMLDDMSVYYIYDGTYRYAVGTEYFDDGWSRFGEDGILEEKLEGVYYIDDIKAYQYFEGGYPVPGVFFDDGEGNYYYSDEETGAPYISVTAIIEEVAYIFDSEGVGTLFTGIFDGKTYIEGFEEYINVAGYSISLNGTIDLNFYVEMSDIVMSNEKSRVVFSVEGKETELPIWEYVEKDGYFGYSVGLAASKMSKPVTFEIMIGDSVLLCDTYSVLEYAEIILANEEQSEEYEKARPLVIAMLDFGGCAQKYFGENVNLANECVDKSESLLLTVTDEEILSLENTFSESGELSGIEFTGNALKLDSSVSVYHYFRVTDGDVSDYTFECNGETLTPEYDGEEYYIVVFGITADKLGECYTVSVGDYSFDYCPLNYAQCLIYSGGSEKAKNLVRAVYLYSKAADEYFN